MEFVDRKPRYPNRVLITPESGGSPYYAKVVRADEPTVPGTPLNAANLGKLFGCDLVWENPAPDAGFEITTVAVDLSKYRFVVVVDTENTVHWISTDDRRSAMTGSKVLDAEFQVLHRPVDIGDSGLEFGFCYIGCVFHGGTTSFQETTTSLVPNKIYGIG